MSKIKRGLSFLLCLVMVFSLFSGIPFNSALKLTPDADAADTNTNPGTSDWVTLWHTTPLFLNSGNSTLSMLNTLLTAGSQITFRTLVPITMGGNTMRLTFSNEYGSHSLYIGEITVAKGGGSDVGCWADEMKNTSAVIIKGESTLKSVFSEAIAAGKAGYRTDGDGHECIVIYAGQTVNTNAIDVSNLNLNAMDNVSVSTWLCNIDDFTEGITGGLIGARTSYLRIAGGTSSWSALANCNHTEAFDLDDEGIISDVELSSSDDTGDYNIIPFLTGIEVKRSSIKGVTDTANAYTTVILGDSTVTNEIPIYLAQKLRSNGIGGVAVTYASAKGSELLMNGQSSRESDGTSDYSGPPMGKSGLAVMQDVVNLPGVKKIIVKEGINDILHPYCDDLDSNYSHLTSAAEIIAGYKQLIKMAHDKGIEIYFYELSPWIGTDGSSTTSYKRDGNLIWELDTTTDADKVATFSAAEGVRTAVNNWLKTYGKEYDEYATAGRNTNNDGAAAISIGNNNYGASSYGGSAGGQDCDAKYARTPADVSVSGNFDTFGFISLESMNYGTTGFLNAAYTTDGIHYSSAGQAEVSRLTPSQIFYQEKDYEAGAGASSTVTGLLFNTQSLQENNDYVIVNTNGIGGTSTPVYNNAGTYNQSITGYAVDNTRTQHGGGDAVYHSDISGSSIKAKTTLGKASVTVQVGTSQKAYLVRGGIPATTIWTVTGDTDSYIWKNVYNNQAWYLAWYWYGSWEGDRVFPTSAVTTKPNTTGGATNEGWFSFDTISESSNKMAQLYYKSATDANKNLIFFNKNMDKEWKLVRLGAGKYEYQLSSITNQGSQYATGLRNGGIEGEYPFKIYSEGERLDVFYETYDLALFNTASNGVKTSLDLTCSDIDETTDNTRFIRKASGSTIQLQYKLDSQMLDSDNMPTGETYSDSPANNNATGPFKLYTFGDNQRIFWYSSDTSVATVSQSDFNGTYASGGGKVTFTGNSGITDIVANYLWTEYDGVNYVFDTNPDANGNMRYYSGAQKDALIANGTKVPSTDDSGYHWIEITNGTWVWTNYHWISTETTIINVKSYGADILAGAKTTNNGTENSFTFIGEATEKERALTAVHVSDPVGLTLPGEGWTWTSSDTSVATVTDEVNDYAKLNLLKAGTATITATRVDGDKNPVKNLDGTSNITSSITVTRVDPTFTATMYNSSGTAITAATLNTYCGKNTETLIVDTVSSNPTGCNLPDEGEWTWTSDNPNAVSVSGAGQTATITGGSASGNAKITATFTYNGRTLCTTYATVTNIPTVTFTSEMRNSSGTKITAHTLNGFTGLSGANTVSITATETGSTPSGKHLADYADGKWVWSSSDTSVATVAKSDSATNSNYSTATVTGTSKNGTATITAKYVSTSKGEITSCTVTITNTGTVTFTSAVKNSGGTNITDTTQTVDSYTGTATMSVTAAQTGSDPSGKNLSDYPSGHWVWSSSNTSVATVTKTDTGTNSNSTSATVTCTTTNGDSIIYATYYVGSKAITTSSFTVHNVASVEFTAKIKQGSTDITGSTQTLKTFTGASTLNVTAAQTASNPTGKNLSAISGGKWYWTSSNTSVATVAKTDSNGQSNSTTATVTGTTTNGTATITAEYKVGTKVYATCSFTVKNEGTVTFTSNIKQGSTVVSGTTQTLKTFTGANTLTVTAAQTGSTPTGKSLGEYTDGKWVWESSNTSAVQVGTATTASNKESSTVTLTGTATNADNVTITAKYVSTSKGVITSSTFTVKNLGTVSFTSKMTYTSGTDAITAHTLKSFTGANTVSVKAIQNTVTPSGSNLSDYTDGKWVWSSSDTSVATVSSSDAGTNSNFSTATVTGTSKTGTATITAKYVSTSKGEITSCTVTITNQGTVTFTSEITKSNAVVSDYTFDSFTGADGSNYADFKVSQKTSSVTGANLSDYTTGKWVWSSSPSGVVTIGTPNPSNNSNYSTVRVSATANNGDATVYAKYMVGSTVITESSFTVHNIASVAFTAKIKQGSTDITNKTQTLNSFTGVNTIDVTAEQASSTPTGKNLSAIKGGQWYWTSSNTSVATVAKTDSNGQSNSTTATVTGTTTNGEATITAEYKVGTKVYATCYFKVDNTGTATFTSKIMKGSTNVTGTTETLKSFTGYNTLTVTAEQASATPDGKNLSDYPNGGWVWSSSDETKATVAKTDTGTNSNSSTATITGKTSSTSNNGTTLITAKFTDNGKADGKVITSSTFTVDNIGKVTFTSQLKYGSTVIKNGVPDTNIETKTLNSYQGLTKNLTFSVTASADVAGCSLSDYTDGYWVWTTSSTTVKAEKTDNGTDKTKSTVKVTGSIKVGTPTVTAEFKCGSETIVYAKVKVKNVGTKLDIQILNDSDASYNYPDSKTIQGVVDGDTLTVKVKMWQDGKVKDVDASKITSFAATCKTDNYGFNDNKDGTATITFKNGKDTDTIAVDCSYTDKTNISSAAIKATTTKIIGKMGINTGKNYVFYDGLPTTFSVTGKIAGITTSDVTKIASPKTLYFVKYETEDCCNGRLTKNYANFGNMAVTPATEVGAASTVSFTPNGISQFGSKTYWFAAECNNELDPTVKYKYSYFKIYPASTVYYDDYLPNNSSNSTNGITYTDGVGGSTGTWSIVGTQLDAEALAAYAYDNNNYDYSLGSSHKVTVSKDNNPTGKYTSTGDPGKWPSASFTFNGTGFDVISRTGSDCGMVRVSVSGSNGINKNYIVDTYRGYSLGTADSSKAYIRYTWFYNSDGTWHIKSVNAGENAAPNNGTYISKETYDKEIGEGKNVKPDNPKQGDTFNTYVENKAWQSNTSGVNTYQVPIIKIFPNGATGTAATYTVTITPMYSSAFDRAGRNSYDFYLDAIRIYTNNNKEGYAKIFNLKELLKANVGTLDSTGTVIIDGSATATAANYNDYGANNEIYLNSGNALTFKLTASANPSKVQLGLKTYDTASALVKVTYLSSKTTEYETVEIPVNSKTDTYHKLENVAKDSNITISNTCGSTVVLTTLKVVFSSSNTATIEPVESSAETLSANTAYLMDEDGEDDDEPIADDGEEIICDLVISEDILKEGAEFHKAALLAAASKPKESFAPTVSVDAPETVTVGEDVTLTVTTSSDVAYITVNGNKVEENEDFVWTYTVTAEEVGEMSFEVKAYNADGAAAEEVKLATVTVEKEPFVPEVSVDAPETVTVGDDVTLTVTTSSDVAYITVNGEKVESHDEDFVWTYTATAEEVGEMSFEVMAYNADDEASDDIYLVTVAVEKKPFEPLINVIAPANVTVGETITVQVVTGDDVAYITVNGVKVETKEGSVWVYTTTAEAEGELDFVIVAYNEDGEAAENTKTATVSVTQQAKSAWQIIITSILSFFKKLLGTK